MKWPKVFCLLWGHDDHLRRTSGRLYLECWECGRATRGWTIAPGSRAERTPDTTRTSSMAASLLQKGWHTSKELFEAFRP